MNDDVCPVCGEETEDMRHVDVECFYRVNEHAPHLYERPRLVEVPEGPAYIGRLRRYSGGEERRFVQDEVTPSEFRVVPRWDALPQPSVLLQEQMTYGIRCCKRCRADFIGLFLRWSRGHYATPPASATDDARCVPVRKNGAVVMLTVEEWHARQAARQAATP